MKVASFDLGIINFACVIADFDVANDSSTKIPVQIQHVFHIDITHYTHKTISKSDCLLHHTNELSDRLLHTLQELQPYLKNIDTFLIERQPINSTCTSIEEIMFQKYRSQIHKVSPTRMHKRFQLSDDYDTRKLQSITLATPLLEDFEVFQTAERKHDQADALLLACSFILDLVDKQTAERAVKKRRIQVEEAINEDFDTFFSKYAYKPNTNPKVS
jgi:hypothetical protein